MVIAVTRSRIGKHLSALENEAIHVLREVAAQCEQSVVLFSGGKDSIVTAWLARKAFFPAPMPFPLLHIDTGHNFAETLTFRDAFTRDLSCDLVVRCVQESIDRGRVKEETGPFASRNTLQSVTLIDAITELRVDAAISGARRDEEKARAKERVFSHRDALGQWDPKHQRPELWNLYNGRKAPGEHFRVFPLSNWTELDVWQYIASEGITLPALYFAHHRQVFERDGMLVADSPFVQRLDTETVTRRLVRFRTLGDAVCSGAIESTAATVADVIHETAAARVGERGGRLDDRRSETAMEDRKRHGYF
jgi:sulfate adenylyltransferase subunit 2